MASLKVTVRAVKHRGKTQWRVRYWNNGKLCRPLFASKKKADAKAAMLRGQSTHADTVWEQMSTDDRQKLISKYEATGSGSPSVSAVIKELIEKKENAGRSDDYTDNLDNILTQFANGHASKPIESFTVVDVEKFLDSKLLASRSTLRARISTLFKFSVRRGYREANPCDALEPVTYHKPPPKVFTTQQFKDSVEWLKQKYPSGLAWFALSTVCGLRPEEAEKTTIAEINFKEGFIRVEKQTTKVRMRRVVYPKKEALKFLKWTTENGGELPMDSQKRKRFLAGSIWKSKDGPQRRPGLRHGLGFATWPKDITRHTAASYWLASDGSAAHVAEMLGHSEKTLKSHYKALVTRKEAAKFWEVVSSCLKT